MGISLKGSFSTVPLTQWQIRAWALAQCSGSAHFDAENGFSSLVDNGAGSFTFHFSTNMSDSNYVITGSTGRNGQPHFSLTGNARAADQFTIATGTWGTSYNNIDCDSVMLVVCK